MKRTCAVRTKALVLELLAAVCLVRGGHDIILSAFDHFQEVRRASEVQAGEGGTRTLVVCWFLILQTFRFWTSGAGQ